MRKMMKATRWRKRNIHDGYKVVGCPLLVGLLLLSLLSACSAGRLVRQEKRFYPKREFRGAWIQTVFQDDYRSLTTESFRLIMDERLDLLQAAGINAIVFQIRPEADAFYPSALEPWSRFLTGQQGVSPDDPSFDPMEYLIEACHQRNMEFHAWMNPYRAGAGGFADFAENHLIYKRPEWFVSYGNLTLFDPGIPDCRRWICRVVKDVVSRYDVDAIHMDDYFYPYPILGEPFPDDRSFARYGTPRGFRPDQRNAWRRDNVNQLIREIKETIVAEKPWVRFGISPFGIYRNYRNDRSGSHTNGLQNYDDLHADVLLWMRKGWIDYCVPQLYWEIGHKTADYRTLVRWWGKRKGNTPLYVGQDVARTMKNRQLLAKMVEERAVDRFSGHIFWPANELLRNNGGVVDSLMHLYHRYPALIPAYTQMTKRKPGRVEQVSVRRVDGGVQLRWKGPPRHQKQNEPSYYVIYYYPHGEPVDLERAASIAAQTREYRCFVPVPASVSQARFYVTAVDRYHQEGPRSQPVRITFE